MLHTVLLCLWYLVCFLLGFYNDVLNTAFGEYAFSVGMLTGVALLVGLAGIKKIADYFEAEVG